jgi:hypothetical protein
MKVVVLPPVWIALLESAEWYDMERTGLGPEFLRHVKSTLVTIGHGAARYPAIYRDARRAQVPMFPFGIFFVIRDETVFVFRIVHLHRHPKHWRKYLPPKKRRLP